MKKSINKQKGKILEKNYEWLWELGINKNCIITSPKYYTDTVTGEQREIDVFVEVLDESHEKVIETIMIECRNRINVQDVTWVEQIVTKRNDLKIDRAIMVTTTDFTEPARKKAHHYNIEMERASSQSEEFIKKQQETCNGHAQFIFIECNSIIIHTDKGVYGNKQIKKYPKLISYLKSEISAFTYSDFFVSELQEKHLSDSFFEKSNNKLNITFSFTPKKSIGIPLVFPLNNDFHTELGQINLISFSIVVTPKFISFPLINVITIFDDNQLDKTKTNKRHKSIYENDRIKLIFQIHNDKLYHSLSLKKPNIYWRFYGFNVTLYALLGNVAANKIQFDLENNPAEMLGKIFFNNI